MKEIKEAKDTNEQSPQRAVPLSEEDLDKVSGGRERENDPSNALVYLTEGVCPKCNQAFLG